MAGVGACFVPIITVEALLELVAAVERLAAWARGVGGTKSRGRWASRGGGPFAAGQTGLPPAWATFPEVNRRLVVRLLGVLLARRAAAFAVPAVSAVMATPPVGGGKRDDGAGHNATRSAVRSCGTRARITNRVLRSTNVA